MKFMPPHIHTIFCNDNIPILDVSTFYIFIDIQNVYIANIINIQNVSFYRVIIKDENNLSVSINFFYKGE